MQLDVIFRDWSEFLVAHSEIYIIHLMCVFFRGLNSWHLPSIEKEWKVSMFAYRNMCTLTHKKNSQWISVHLKLKITDAFPIETRFIVRAEFFVWEFNERQLCVFTTKCTGTIFKCDSGKNTSKNDIYEWKIRLLSSSTLCRRLNFKFAKPPTHSWNTFFWDAEYFDTLFFLLQSLSH